jgi:hypothetical protein
LADFLFGDFFLGGELGLGFFGHVYITSTEFGTLPMKFKEL